MSVLHPSWLVPAVLLLLVAATWLARRDSAAVAITYTPPAALRAGEAGVVIDGHVHTADVVASVVDLAVRGYLALEPVPGDVVVRVARPWLHDRDIRTFEAVLLAHVFTDGVHTVRLSALRGAGYAPESVKDQISQDLAAVGIFAVGPRAMLRAGRVAALAATAIWAQVAWNHRAGWSAFAAGAATGVASWLLAGQLARGGHTADGLRARRQLDGYREYLARVDKDRLEALPPGTLDEHLPWAIALGVTEGWLAR